MNTWRGIVEPSVSNARILSEVFHELRIYGIMYTKALSRAAAKEESRLLAVGLADKQP
jgi:hypothetical protein